MNYLQAILRSHYDTKIERFSVEFFASKSEILNVMIDDDICSRALYRLFQGQILDLLGEINVSMQC